ncbi:MAG: c-type cytochrome [Caldimicrobium sp.]|nr:c-type cytochrome [Caldimicrobium sp.]MCX7613356.1 c-type cytochrome [Caldimicrobium sp.]
MLKKGFLLLVFWLGLSNLALATEGEKLFHLRGCSGCHEATKDSVGPALSTISQKYNRDLNRLMKFFKGQADPIIWPDKFRIMEPFMNMLKQMDDKDLKVLGEYILSF